MTHSVFKFKEELLAEFAGIQNPSGTRIIIFNVRTTPDGKPEFDFSTAPDDVRIPEDTDLEISKLRKQERQNHIPESDYSLRVCHCTCYIMLFSLYRGLSQGLNDGLEGLYIKLNFSVISQLQFILFFILELFV